MLKITICILMTVLTIVMIVLDTLMSKLYTIVCAYVRLCVSCSDVFVESTQHTRKINLAGHPGTVYTLRHLLACITSNFTRQSFT